MKKKRSVKNIILKSIMAVVFFIWALSVSALDSASWIPTVLMIITGGILALYALANGWCD